MSIEVEFVSCLGDIISILENLKIPYFIGGSVASGVRGNFRATNDIDIVCKFSNESLNDFTKHCEDKFFVDDLQAKKAFKDGGSFNIIHIVACIKVDIFTKLNDFQELQLQRASTVGMYNGKLHARIASSEDVILAKLRWFRIGGGVSDRQWSDVCGVIKVQGERLDREYLRDWAAKLSLTDLLEKAFSQCS